MISYSTNELCLGSKIMFNNEPHIILNNEFVKPGKGQAFNRIRLRNLISGKILDKTFKSSDSVQVADVRNLYLTYLYNDGKLWYFMNNNNFEQIAANTKIISNNSKWLIKQTECLLTIWNGQPIAVVLPNFVELKITETLTITSGKLATLTTGAIVKVPLFMQIGNIIRVDTRSGKYVSRVK